MSAGRSVSYFSNIQALRITLYYLPTFSISRHCGETWSSWVPTTKLPDWMVVLVLCCIKELFKSSPFLQFYIYPFDVLFQLVFCDTKELWRFIHSFVPVSQIPKLSNFPNDELNFSWWRDNGIQQNKPGRISMCYLKTSWSFLRSSDVASKVGSCQSM